MATNRRKQLEYEAIFQKIFILCNNPEEQITIKEFIERLSQYPDDTAVYSNGKIGLNILMVKEVIVNDKINICLE